MQTCPGRVSGFWLRKGQREGLLFHLRPGGPPKQLSAGRLTGAGVVHVPVIHQHLVEQDHAGVAGEGLPGEPHGEGHERRRWSPWGDRMHSQSGPAQACVQSQEAASASHFPSGWTHLGPNLILGGAGGCGSAWGAVSGGGLARA